MRCWAWLLLAAGLGISGEASADPQFSLPVACTNRQDLLHPELRRYRGEHGAKDFTCGALSYDGHKGTDIRLKNIVAMEAGVDVLAAAAGTVLRTRDGMNDINVREIGAAAVKNREAGNSVIVDHGDGWVTQYSHMKKGSVAGSRGNRLRWDPPRTDRPLGQHRIPASPFRGPARG